MTRLLRYTVVLLLLAIAMIGVLIYSLTWRPDARETLPVSCTGTPPTLVPGQALKVMTWNVQYLAGKRYVFWNDLAQGEDEAPTAEDMAFSLDEVARVIRDEQPDVVLLQELDDGAKASDYQNQLKLLQERVADLYPCSASAFDWKAEFVPDPQIFGSVGRQLATLSRYRIEHAERLQLPVVPGNIITRQFQRKDALLASKLPLSDGGQLTVFNTHLQRARQPDEILQAQVAAVAKVLDKYESQGLPWLIGGDFNLLPLGQYRRLSAEQRTPYSADSELHLLWDKYPMTPTNNEASGIDRAQWLTHYPNDPGLNGPDRTVDYLFHSPKIKRLQARVRQDDTLRISDHLPVIARFLLPAAP